MGNAQLTFYLSEGVLTGYVAGKWINIYALSGGGGGTKKKSGPDEPGTVNNPYRTGQRERGSVRGGPLPAGRYEIGTPIAWHHGRAARLTPSVSADKFTNITGRDGGFLIHGRGPKGSDGCIVPKYPADFQELMDGLANDKGGVLFVLEGEGGVRFA